MPGRARADDYAPIVTPLSRAAEPGGGGRAASWRVAPSAALYVADLDAIMAGRPINAG